MPEEPTTPDTPRLFTVRDLRHLLAEAEDDCVVIVAKDPEGNGYSPLSGVLGGGPREWTYLPDTTWSGYVREGLPSTQQRVDGTAARCIVIEPIN